MNLTQATERAATATLSDGTIASVGKRVGLLVLIAVLVSCEHVGRDDSICVDTAAVDTARGIVLRNSSASCPARQ